MPTPDSPTSLVSPHFTLGELTLSQAAIRRGLDNTPTPPVLRSLGRLAQALERVRQSLGGVPILISSGYRAPAVNQAVGGASNSAHLRGLAAASQHPPSVTRAPWRSTWQPTAMCCSTSSSSRAPGSTSACPPAA